MSAIAAAAAAAASKRDSKSNIKDKEQQQQVRDNNNQKSSVNANNNNNNNTNINKVVNVAPSQQQIPLNIALAAAAKANARTPSPSHPSDLQQAQAAPVNQAAAAAASSNVTIPHLKKRTVVKAAVPPPVPPRGSPRSKSNLIGVSSTSFLIHDRPVDDVLVGCRKKVEQWLATIEPLTVVAQPETLSSLKFNEFTPSRQSVAVEQSIHFNSVGKLIEAFATPPLPQQQSRQARLESAKNSKRSRKVADSQLVRCRIDGYNSLDRYPSRTTINRNLMSSDGGTDSGIDIPTQAGMRICLTTARLNRRRGGCHDEEREEFV